MHGCRSAVMKNNKPAGRDSKDKNDLVKWSGFGLEFAGVIVVLCYIGYKIDAALNSSPYFLLGGFFTGFTGMLYLAYKQMNNDKK